MKILIGLIVVAVLAYLVVLVVGYFSSGSREVRATDNKAKTELLHTRRQLHAAKSALIRIAANDSGSPVLDAQIALEEIQRAELNELEN